MAVQPFNPAVPPLKYQRSSPQAQRTSAALHLGPSTIGVGSRREYLNVTAQAPNLAYPPRVPPGSVADLDLLYEQCAFDTGKYVRDCLEVLRVGAGLDNGRHARRGNTEHWNYIFQEAPMSTREPPPQRKPLSIKQQKMIKQGGSDAGLSTRDVLEAPLTNFTNPIPPKPHADLRTACDPNYPRIFHMFWAGPFNDKPYTAMLSFLFTQNLGLHLDKPESKVCRPQFWMWINPGPAAAIPNPNAVSDMFRDLSNNPWASPFLHPRFKDVIQFKMWNTTEQLDAIPELKDEWRAWKDDMFNSGGTKFKVAADKEEKKPEPKSQSGSALGSHPANATASAQDPEPTADEIVNRLGSSSSDSYDRLTVVLSDMVRFVLCHRYGGIYLDADTVLLRDWEELWGWKGAFAYRWSWHQDYNTAVLKLNKRSALGTFLFRTAFRKQFDFHPMTISQYTRHAFLDNLLIRLPDALFDSAWLNQEGYQREKPPFPFFTNFTHFFAPPQADAAPPLMLGYDGFFRGAYSYHYHNNWWVAFDDARNFPDLGPQFKKGEVRARMRLKVEAAAEAELAKRLGPNYKKAGKDTKRPAPSKIPDATAEDLRQFELEDDDVQYDSRDLSWSAVVKRTFEAYIRGERPNMYGEWLKW